VARACLSSPMIKAYDGVCGLGMRIPKAGAGSLFLLHLVQKGFLCSVLCTVLWASVGLGMAWTDMGVTGHGMAAVLRLWAFDAMTSSLPGELFYRDGSCSGRGMFVAAWVWWCVRVEVEVEVDGVWLRCDG